jgi:hypothetical protein
MLLSRVTTYREARKRLIVSRNGKLSPDNRDNVFDIHEKLAAMSQRRAKPRSRPCPERGSVRSDHAAEASKAFQHPHPLPLAIPPVYKM